MTVCHHSVVHTLTKATHCSVVYTLLMHGPHRHVVQMLTRMIHYSLLLTLLTESDIVVLLHHSTHIQHVKQCKLVWTSNINRVEMHQSSPTRTSSVQIFAHYYYFIPAMSSKSCNALSMSSFVSLVACRSTPNKSYCLISSSSFLNVFLVPFFVFTFFSTLPLQLLSHFGKWDLMVPLLTLFFCTSATNHIVCKD